MREYKLELDKKYIGIVEDTIDGRVTVHLFGSEKDREDAWQIFSEKGRAKRGMDMCTIKFTNFENRV